MNSIRMMLLCSVAATAGWGTTAMAQESQSVENGLSEIIVTANRREQRLQDVPLSVSAISTETLRNQNVNTLIDVGAGRIPGLTIVPMFGNPAAAIITIRGQSPGDPSQGTKDMPVAFYVDGINFPRAQGLALDLVTPERIEVLRGPQGQLFGRNAEAGVVQIVTKRPTGEWGGEVTGSIASYSTSRLKAMLNLPEIAGFRVQLSGFHRNNEGFTDNVRNPLLQGIVPFVHPLAKIKFKRGNYDSDFGATKSYGARIAIARDFGPLNAFYTYDNTWVKETQGLTTFTVDPNCGGINNPQCIANADYLSRVFTSNGVFVQSALGNDYPEAVESSIFAPTMITKSRGHMLNLTLDASDTVTLKSISGYRNVTRYGYNSSNLAVSPAYPNSGEYLDSKVLSQELQLQYNVDNFNLTTGAIYFQEKIEDQRENSLGVNCGNLGAALTPRCDPVGQPVQGPYYATFTANGATNVGFRAQTAKTKAYAAYAQATWTPAILEEALELTGGIRYSHDTKRGRRHIFAGNVLAVPITNEAKTDRFDPAFTVKYTFSPALNVYARYASGFRDGGANVRSNTFNSFKAETMKSYEIGLKSQFLDNRVILNLAAFSNTIKGQQLDLQPNPQNPGITDTINFPFDTKIKGLEAELNVRPFEGLTISASGSYLKKNDNQMVGYDSVTFETFRPGIASFDPLNGLVVDAATAAAHPNSIVQRLAPYGAPKWSGYVALDYETSFTGESSLQFHIDYTKTSTWYTSGSRTKATLIGGVQTKNPTYNSGVARDRANMKVSWRNIGVGNTKMDFSLFADNLFDHVDKAFVYTAGNGINAQTPAAHAPALLLMPRIIGAEVRVHF
jgi:iron complex outermembrane receptor protein